MLRMFEVCGHLADGDGEQLLVDAGVEAQDLHDLLIRLRLGGESGVPLLPQELPTPAPPQCTCECVNIPSCYARENDGVALSSVRHQTIFSKLGAWRHRLGESRDGYKQVLLLHCSQDMYVHPATIVNICSEAAAQVGASAAVLGVRWGPGTAERARTL